MTSTTVQPTADLIAAVLAGLAVTPTVKSYRWDIGMAGLDALPAAIIGIPEVRRIAVEGFESQLGSRDWHLTYPIHIYVDLAEAVTAQVQVVDILEAFIKAVDTDTLQAQDATIIDAKVIEAIPAEYVDAARPMLAYECRLELLKLV